MEIEVNGDRHQVPFAANLAEILVFLGLPKDRVAVELDRKIVRKTDWESCQVAPGAELEVVHKRSHEHLALLLKPYLGAGFFSDVMRETKKRIRRELDAT